MGPGYDQSQYRVVSDGASGHEGVVNITDQRERGGDSMYTAAAGEEYRQLTVGPKPGHLTLGTVRQQIGVAMLGPNKGVSYEIEYSDIGEIEAGGHMLRRFVGKALRTALSAAKSAASQQ